MSVAPYQFDIADHLYKVLEKWHIFQELCKTESTRLAQWKSNNMPLLKSWTNDNEKQACLALYQREVADWEREKVTEETRLARAYLDSAIHGLVVATGHDWDRSTKW